MENKKVFYKRIKTTYYIILLIERLFYTMEKQNEFCLI